MVIEFLGYIVVLVLQRCLLDVMKLLDQTTNLKMSAQSPPCTLTPPLLPFMRIKVVSYSWFSINSSNQGYRIAKIRQNLVPRHAWRQTWTVTSRSLKITQDCQQNNHMGKINNIHHQTLMFIYSLQNISNIYECI